MSHATSAELGTWLDPEAVPPESAAPADATRLLTQATRLVDSKVVSGYVTDAADLPTEPHVIAALRDATCAQVEQWLSVGEDNDYDGYRPDTAVSASGVSLSSRPSRLAPRARQALRDAGLLVTRLW